MIPKRLVELVLERDGARCVIAGPRCMGSASLAHHRANRGMGGARALNDPRNLVAACGLCNSWIEDVTGAWREWAIERGVRVERAATTAATLNRCAAKPVQYGVEVWRFLLADGRFEECTPPEF